MEVRTLDPRTIKANPNNPRRTTPPKESDASLLASIKTLGILQPPVVAPDEEGFMVIAGARRIKAAIKLKMPEIHVLVRDPDEDNGQMASVAENVVRESMSLVDLWRAFEALSGAGWTDPTIAAALAINKKMIRQLRLFGRIHPPMLDQMARGDMPDEEERQIIAMAPQDEQAAIWKIHKPKTKDEQVNWYQISEALEKRRMYAKYAKFDDVIAKAYGIVWEEDLFEQADEDPQYTTQVEAFLGAQTEWIYNQLNGNTILLTKGKNREVELPAGARRNYGDPEEGDKLGYYVDEYRGEVKCIRFQMSNGHADGKASAPTRRDATPKPEQPKTRAPITQKGQTMIGEYRTNALRKALTQNDFDDETLIGLLILAFSANNVSIRSNSGDHVRDLAVKLTEGGRINKDINLLRETGRKILASLFSCEDNYASSGLAARIAGDTIGAGQHLDNMATEEFLGCLSKAEIEKTAAELGIKPRDRAKDTRAAILAQAGTAGLVLPIAHFALTEEEIQIHQEPSSYYRLKQGSENQDRDTSDSCDENESDFPSDEDEAGFPSDGDEEINGMSPFAQPNGGEEEEDGGEPACSGDPGEEGEGDGDPGHEDSHNPNALPETFAGQITNELQPN